MNEPRALLVVVVSLLAGAEGHSQQPPPDDGRERIEWPSREFRSIQSAIDALRDGGTLRFAQGTFEVDQPLVVRDKLAVIEGAGCRELGRRGREKARHTRLIGPRPERVPPFGDGSPLLTHTGSGGIVIKGLELEGFDAGIGLVDGNAQQPARARVTIQDTCISKTVRGISSSHSEIQLVLNNVLIRDVLWNGISVVPAKSLANALLISYGLTVANPGQACVVVRNAAYSAFNTHLQNCGFNGGSPGGGGGILAVGSNVLFADSSVNAPNGPGIAADGGTTIAERSLVFLARGMGILLFEPQSASIHDSHLWLTQPFPGGHPQAGAYGDGVAVAGTGNLWIGDSLIEDSSRAGLSNFGSFASLGGVQVQCAAAFDFEGESHLGHDFTFVDRGGNECGCPEANGVCEAVSVGIAAPNAINPIP